MFEKASSSFRIFPLCHGARVWAVSEVHWLKVHHFLLNNSKPRPQSTLCESFFFENNKIWSLFTSSSSSMILRFCCVHEVASLVTSFRKMIRNTKISYLCLWCNKRFLRKSKLMTYSTFFVLPIFCHRQDFINCQVCHEFLFGKNFCCISRYNFRWFLTTFELSKK